MKTGGCPHTAIREDASVKLEAIDRMLGACPNTDTVFLESGGDNLAAAFSPELSDLPIYGIDVGANLEVMDADTRRVRTTAQELKPFVMTGPKRLAGVDEVVRLIGTSGLLKHGPRTVRQRPRSAPSPRRPKR